jgi:hypothetical protein
MVTTEHATKRRSRQRIRHRNRTRGTGQKASAFCRTAIRRLQDQPTPTSPQPLTRLVEPGNRLPGTSCESKQLADPPGQSRLEFGGEIGRHNDRATRGPGECTPQASLGAGGF